MDDGIGVERMEEEITRWERMFDSELSILQNWDSISKVEIVNGIEWRTREYFEGLLKNKSNSTDIPEENS